jgi:hypothetical protein
MPDREIPADGIVTELSTRAPACDGRSRHIGRASSETTAAAIYRRGPKVKTIFGTSRRLIMTRSKNGGRLIAYKRRD